MDLRGIECGPICQRKSDRAFDRMHARTHIAEPHKLAAFVNSGLWRSCSNDVFDTFIIRREADIRRLNLNSKTD